MNSFFNKLYLQAE